MAYSMRYPKQSRRLKRRRLPSHPQKTKGPEQSGPLLFGRALSRFTTYVLCKELALGTLQDDLDIVIMTFSTDSPWFDLRRLFFCPPCEGGRGLQLKTAGGSSNSPDPKQRDRPLLHEEGTKGRSRGGPSLTFTPLLLLQLVRPGLSLFGRRKSFRHPDRRWLSHQIVVEELKHAQREVLLVLSLSQAVRLAVVC